MSRSDSPPSSYTEGPDLLGIAKTSFVRKLYDLVMTEADHIVSFLPDGTAFEVKDPKQLELVVLPKYFRHSRFQSLVRQLNFYNFKKVSKERHVWIYRHELFQRDRPALLEGLKRKTSQNPPDDHSSSNSSSGGGSHEHALDHHRSYSSSSKLSPASASGSARMHLTSSENGSGMAMGMGIRRSVSSLFPLSTDVPFRRSSSDSNLNLQASSSGHSGSSCSWTEVLDEFTGQLYYWNTFTGQSQWEPPAEFEKAMLPRFDPRRNGVSTHEGNGVAAGHEADNDMSVDDMTDTTSEDSNDPAAAAAAAAAVSGPLPSSTSMNSVSYPRGKRSWSGASASSTGTTASVVSGSSTHTDTSSSTPSPKRQRRASSTSTDSTETAAAAAAAAASAAVDNASDDAGTDDARDSAESHCSEDSDAENTWSGLQVSTEKLGSLQRALYERKTSPALVALVTFGLRTHPYQKPSRLLSAVKSKLNSNAELWKELRRYREALEPKKACLSQHSGFDGSADGMYVGFDGGARLVGMGPDASAENDMCMMREFMAFVVTRLQTVQDLCKEHTYPLDMEHKQLLNGCLRLWWKHASRYL